MINIAWYVTLAIISFGIAVFAMYKNRDVYKFSTFLPFYLFSASIAWIGEFLVLGLFNSYAYKTGVFQDPWAQNLLAHLLLNTTMFPATSIVMIAYSFRYGYMVLVSIIFVFAEYLFVRFGLYEQHWWRYYLSAINVIIFMLVARNWFYRMEKRPTGSTRAIIFYFVALIVVHTPSPILLLLGKQHYYLGFIYESFVNSYRSSTLIAFAYHLLAPFVFAYFVCVKKKWYWKAMCFVFSTAVYSLFVKTHVLVIDDNWKFIYTLLIQEVSIAIFILLEKYTWRPKGS